MPLQPAITDPEAAGEGPPARLVVLAFHPAARRTMTDSLTIAQEPRTAAFRGFFENLAVGGVQISSEGRFLQVNDRFADLTGYSRDKLLRMRVGDLDHPEDREPDRVRWAAFLLDPDAGCDVEKRYVREDGSVIWVHVTAARITDDAGEVLIAKTVEDVTERVAAASAFRGFFENLAVGGVQISNEGRFLQVNERFVKLTGYPRERLLTMRVGDLDHPDDREPDRRRWAAFLGDPGTGYDVEKRYVRQDGSVIWVHVTAARITTGTDRVLIAKTVEDITERVTAAGALRDREEHLRAALAAKEEFLGLVSHELRTPLTVILGLADVAARNRMPPDQLHGTILEIRESADHLASLLESMLVLARVDEERPALEPILLEHAVRGAVERHREVFPNRAIGVESRTSTALVEGHPPWIAQVIANLIGNAEKYSPPETGIAVVIEGDAKRVIVRDIDEGTGIDEADLPFLFDPFYRASRAAAQTGGLGLGLAVCKRLLELQGGRIWATPRVHGAEFGFSLPAIADDEE